MNQALDEILEEKKVTYDLPNRPIYIWLGLLILFTFLWAVKIPGGFFLMTFSCPVIASLGIVWTLKKKSNLEWTYSALFIGLGSIIGMIVLSFEIIEGYHTYSLVGVVIVCIIAAFSFILYYQYALFLIYKFSPISDLVVISHGSLFGSWIIQVLGYLFIFIGFNIASESILGSLLPLGLGVLFSLSRCGIILDKNRNEFKEFKSYFFIKGWSWQSFENFPDAALLNLRYSQDAKHGYFHSTNIKKETQKELVLLTPDHRKRILVKTFKTNEDSGAFSQEICKHFSLNFTKFSPEISAKTAARRRR